MTDARSRVSRTALLMAAAILVSGLVAYAADWAFHTYKNWHQIRLSKCDTPVIRSFARDEFRAGDPVASLTGRHEPWGSVRHGDYTTYFYTSDRDGELWVIARGGKLVAAHLCGYQIRGFTFFETRSWAEAQECGRSREKVLRERLALYTVAGFAGASHPNPD
jgi:hypothetical protein